MALREPEASPRRVPRYDWLIVAVLLAGAFLRCAALSRMDGMLHYDEAFNGVDALSLLRSPRFTPFLPGNYGRESGWCYILTLFIVTWGARPFALRLAAAFASTLTLAASYRLGKELLGTRGATWVTAALAVLYWHVHLSHLALRANLFLLVGSLALAFLLRAHRKNTAPNWAISGLGLGLLAYTYFSAYLWIGFALLTLSVWFVCCPKQRRGILLALLIAFLVFLPMGIYAYSHPDQVLQRAGDVQTLDRNAIWSNLGVWARAWFGHGDENAEFNLPGRAILDAWLGALLLAGLVGLALAPKRRWRAAWVLGLGAASVLPSLLSDYAPHFLRAIGLTVPISLLAGAGAMALERVGRAVTRRSVAVVLPVALIVMAAATTYQDFYVRWLNDPNVFILMEEHINRAINLLHATAPMDMPVYFSPFTPSHPVLEFRSADLAPRHVGAFDSHYCFVVSDVPAAYVSLSMYEPDFRRNLEQWADLSVLEQDQPPSAGAPRYTVYLATPRSDAWTDSGQDSSVFADILQVRSISPISSTLLAGTTIPVRLAIRALRPLDRAYSVFVHLYGDPTPYEGGVMWAQGDSQISVSYHPVYWTPHETIIQEFDLAVPANIPPGQYTIAIGIYEAPSGPRLPITAPLQYKWDYVPLARVEVLTP